MTKAAPASPANDIVLIDVVLTTANGSETIGVPPLRTWKSSARHALTASADDHTLASKVLSETDLAAWVDLDPTLDDVTRFFDDWTAAQK